MLSLLVLLLSACLVLSVLVLLRSLLLTTITTIGFIIAIRSSITTIIGSGIAIGIIVLFFQLKKTAPLCHYVRLVDCLEVPGPATRAHPDARAAHSQRRGQTAAVEDSAGSHLGYF